jgi:hypothetical protein
VNITRAAGFLKIAALLSAIWTSLVAAIILGWQVRAWMLTEEWSPVPVSVVIALAGLERPAVFVTASSDRNHSDIQRITDWLLNLPTSGVLLAVAAILVAFSIAAASIEKEFAEIDE